MRLVRVGDQHAIAHRHAFVDLRPAGRPHLVATGGSRPRVDQAGRAHHQLGDLAAAFAQFVRPGVADTNTDARRAFLPFLEAQRPVVQRRRQAEAEFHQGFLARTVALVHRADLRDGHVRFVHHQQRPAAGRTASAAVRPARAGSGGASSSRCRCSSRPRPSSPDRTGALRQALRLHQLVLRVQLFQALLSSTLIVSMARSARSRAVLA